MTTTDSLCPLVTSYTNELGLDPKVLEKLYLIRKWDIRDDNPIPFIWPSRLRKYIFDLKTEEEDPASPLELRQYQLQQAHHLARMPRFINGDSVGLGKSLDVIATCCWLMDRVPDLKIIVLATKSATVQWSDEFTRFSLLRPFVMKDMYRGMKSSQARYQQMRDFLAGGKKDAFICKYSSLIGTRKTISPGQFNEDGSPARGGKETLSEEIRMFSSILKEHSGPVALVLDEAHKFKGVHTQTRNLVVSIAKHCRWVWGLTATAMKNSLDEFYSIASAISIRPFGNMWEFGNSFCIWRKVYIGRGIKRNVIQGYKNVAEFKKGIRPFYFGRSQAQVKEPLPKLSTMYHYIELNHKQVKLLTKDIPSGEFKLPPTWIEAAGETHGKDRDPSNMMTLLSVNQLVVNHWGLLDRKDEKTFFTPELSPKEESLLDLLDGDLKGEKVIVFTSSKRWIDRLERLTENGMFTSRRFLRITGNEDERKRNEHRRLFQENSEYDLIFINAAGIESINLQQASNMVLLDCPWSWGNLMQLVGRMVRMASPHTFCILHVFMTKSTIDEYTIDVLRSKKGVFESILGQSHSAGILDEKEFLDLESGMECSSDEEFKLALLRRAHVRSSSLKTFLLGVPTGKEGVSGEEWEL